MSAARVSGAGAAALMLLAGCAEAPPPPATVVVEAPRTPPAEERRAPPLADVDKGGAQAEIAAPPPPEEEPPQKIFAESGDPLKGHWKLADALNGLPPGKTVVASIETSLGTLSCELYDRKAPIAVAHFVGLARGTRPWLTPLGTWEKRPAYDGTIFHRVIKGFMIQGGDPKKDGSGDAGFMFPDEVWPGALHDRAGLLCAANRGPHTNSVQFFITDAAAPHLDKGYTIFGECSPLSLVHQIASVPVGARDRPAHPPVIRRVKITRR